MIFHHINSNITLGDVIDTCDLKYIDFDRKILISGFLRPSVSCKNDLTFYNNSKYSIKRVQILFLRQKNS